VSSVPPRNLRPSFEAQTRKPATDGFEAQTTKPARELRTPYVSPAARHVSPLADLLRQPTSPTTKTKISPVLPTLFLHLFPLLSPLTRAIQVIDRMHQGIDRSIHLLAFVKEGRSTRPPSEARMGQVEQEKQVKDRQHANGAAPAIALLAMSYFSSLVSIAFSFAANCLSPNPSLDRSIPTACRFEGPQKGHR
jgi:hypothetical protein